MTARRLFLVFAALLMAYPASATEPVEPPRIHVTGTGEAHSAPDIAMLTLGFVTEGASAREALDANNRAMRQAVDLLKQAGIADRDLQTSRLNVQPRFATAAGARERITGAQANNQLQVRIRDLAKVGDVVDRVAGLGLNSITGPVFTLENPAPALDAARRAAVADAERRARVTAEALGLRLGRVLRVNDGGGGPVRPAMALRAAEAAPVEPGETTITAQVEVVWELVR